MRVLYGGFTVITVPEEDMYSAANDAQGHDGPVKRPRFGAKAPTALDYATTLRAEKPVVAPPARTPGALRLI